MRMNKKILWLVIALLAIGCSHTLRHHLFKAELIVQNQDESYVEFLTRFTHLKTTLWESKHRVIDIFFYKTEEGEHLIGVIIYQSEQVK